MNTEFSEKIDPAQPVLKAPFPWFGGKSRAADLIWPRLGKVPNYVEPFAGSLAVLLRRPHAPGNEIVNDLDCYVANAWRAMAAEPQQVAQYCDWPVNEADLHARHRWLHGRMEFRLRMENEPDFFDARIAGYWIWGLSCWIGDNFCRPKVQGGRPNFKGRGIVSDSHPPADGIGKKRPNVRDTFGVHAMHLQTDRTKPRTTGGQGVARQVPHLTGGKGGSPSGAAPDVASCDGENVHAKRPQIQRRRGRGCNAAPENKFPPGSQGIRPAWAGKCGVHTKEVGGTTGIWRKRPELESDKGGFFHGQSNGHCQTENLIAWFDGLAARLRHVKVCCGGWERVCTKAATFGQGLTAVLLDPPYDPALCDTVYGDHHGASVSAEVRAWALEAGKNPLMRIALCGYIGEHDMPADWECVAWKASGGYASAAGNHENSKKERIWFSPNCLNTNPELFT